MNLIKPKTKKEKQIQLIIIIVILLVVFYFLWKKVIQPRMGGDVTEPSASGSGGSSGSGSSSNTVTCSNATILKKGSSCKAQVKKLQNHYNVYYASVTGIGLLAEDGVFGTKTENAVKSIMNKTSTSVAEFEAKITSALGSFEWADSSWGGGWSSGNGSGSYF